MNITNIKVITGPSYWSGDHTRLIVACFSGNIRQEDSVYWQNALNDVLPSADVGWLQASPLMALHVIGEIAIRLQNATGFLSRFHQVIEDAEECDHQLIFEYEEAGCGKKAVEQAFLIYKQLADKKQVDALASVTELKEILNAEKLGPSTYSIYKEAIDRGIPVFRLDDNSLLQLGYGVKQKRMEATISANTNTIAVDIAGDKQRTKEMLTAAYLPVPAGMVIQDVEKIGEAINKIGFPVVVKPLDGNQGKGATTNISSHDDAVTAFRYAASISENVVIEKHITGNDYRILVVNNKFVAAALRTPACVDGDGVHTIRDLIEIANRDPRRGDGHMNVLTKIPSDKCTEEFLAKQGYTLDTVPARNEKVLLRSTANLSTGGTAEDVTDRVHSSNISLFERTARVIGLDICGIDVVATDLSTPILENGGSIIEVNAAPGIRMHLQPSFGEPRNVAKPIVDMLFGQDDGRIPVVAITGTNGKTTTTRLIARMAQQHGYNTGFTTTDGIYLNKELIYKGDCSGPQSARVVLRDSAVEFAVLETARGGIIRSGLGFEQCDCAVITNVAEDHLGLNGIHTIEQLAKVKSTVAKAVKRGGWVVLNADDDLVYAMRHEVKGNVALFSLHPESNRIQAHCEAGGVAAFCDEGFVMIRQGNTMLPVEEIENVPLTYGGKAKFNVANVLGATLASWLMKISLPAIRCSLRNFRNSTESTPGRLNVFDFGDFNVIMDYAHNPHGLKALGEFIHSVPANRRIGVIAAVGDRRNEDIIKLGEIAGRIFDDVIIRMDEDLRGRTEFELCSLLRSGVQRSSPDKSLYYFSSEAEAVEYAIRTAAPNSLIVLLVEDIRQVSEKIKELKDLRREQAGSEMKMTG